MVKKFWIEVYSRRWLGAFDMKTSTERKRFEEWISSPPYEWSVDRYPNDESKYAWPGQYKNINVQVAWEAWQAAKERAI